MINITDKQQKDKSKMQSFKEFILILEKNELIAKDAAKIDTQTGNAEDKINKIHQLYGKIEQTLKENETKLIGIMKSVGNKYKNVQYKTRVKTLDSIISKIVMRNKKIADIADLVGGMIIADNSKDSAAIVKDFVRKYGTIVTNVDEKTLGNTPSGYYGAFHLDVDMNGIQCEVQILHSKLEKQKNLAHTVYTSTRDSGATAQDNDLSRRLFRKGNMESVMISDYTLITESLEEILKSLINMNI